MASMRELARLMKELEDQLIVCMRCGMCQAVCPLYAETGREPDVARGKLALLDGLMQEMFKDPKGVYERLNRCLLCGSCGANCPSGVSVLGIFLRARTILITTMGLPPVKRVLLRGMLAHPGLFDRVMEWASKFQKIIAQPADDLMGTSCARFTSPLLSSRHFKPLAVKPLHARIPCANTKPGKSGLRVAFFVGCLIDKIFPDVGLAALKIFRHHGVGVFMPEGQGCCGIPALSSGDDKTFNELVRHNLKLLASEPFDLLVTACATCTATIKKIWPMMASNEIPELKEGVTRLSEKTMDITQFLVEKVGVRGLEAPQSKDPISVTYHDPCHLKKSLGVSTEPRDLIRANPKRMLVEMVEADWCCGMGGSFNLEYYDLSSAIGRRKSENIRNCGCSVVATGCPACMMQISDMLSQQKAPILVKHAIQVYAESLE